jgi:glycosyltransferase involved in cell wall biosynthesis
MPSVSVIIPTYNHRAYVLETLESVFAQTFTDYEVIVVNDGSPDDTAELLRPLAEQGRIRYIEQPNAGQAAARNRGLAEARGEFIAFLDDDDLWPPDKLEWQVAEMNSDPRLVAVYGWHQDAFSGDPPEEIVVNRQAVDIQWNNWIITPGQGLIRRQVTLAIGGFDLTLNGADDWDLWIRLFASGPVKYVRRVSLYYRRHSSNDSADPARMFQRCRRVIKKHHPLPTTMKAARLRRRSEQFLRSAYAPQILAHATSARRLGGVLSAAAVWPPLLFRRRLWEALLVCLIDSSGARKDGSTPSVGS